MNGDVSETCHITGTPAFLNRLTSGLHNFLLKQEMTDFLIRVQNQTIPCHRLIIASSCPVFKALLSSGMTETDKQEVTLDLFTYDVIRNIIGYFYCGHVTIPWSDMMETLKACDFLQLEELKELCVEKIVSAISREEAIGWYKMADQLHLKDIKAKCIAIMVAEFAFISGEAAFLELSLEELVNYVLIMNANGLANTSAIDACLRWVNFDKPNRQDHILDILQHLPLHRTSIRFVQRVMQKYEDLCNDLGVQKYISNALLSLATSSTSPSSAIPCLLVAGGSDRIYAWNEEAWSVVGETPSTVSYQWASICSTEGGLVLTGGYCHPRATRTCHRYRRGRWSTLASMPVERYCHGSVCHSSTIFVLGGYVDFKKSSTVMSMRLKGSHWRPSRDAPEPLKYPKVASIADSIYVLPDRDSTKAKLKLYSYTPKTDTWQDTGSLPIEIPSTEGISIETVGISLYMAGGKKSVCAKFNTGTRVWTLLSSPLLRHGFGALTFYEGRLLLLGGSNWDREFVTVEEYDLDRGSWSVSDMKLPLPLFYHQAMVLSKGDIER